MSRSSCGCVTEWNCLPSNMSHVLKRVHDVLIEFTVNTNLPFRTAKSFQLLEILKNPTIVKLLFAFKGNNAGFLPSKCHNGSRQLIAKTSRPQSESSVLYSLHILHGKHQTHHDSRHWPRLCTGRVSDSHLHCYKPQLCCEGLWSFPIAFLLQLH